METKYYLAYGSNLDIGQMQYRCPQARKVGTAVLEGYRLLFKGSRTGAYLTIEQAEGEKVPVGVWSVSAADEKRLDIYEGFPNFYYKKEIKGLRVQMEKGRMKGTEKNVEKLLDCFVYIMHEERREGIPSVWYIATCLEGYGCFEFDDTPLIKAYCHAVQHSVAKDPKIEYLRICLNGYDEFGFDKAPLVRAHWREQIKAGYRDE